MTEVDTAMPEGVPLPSPTTAVQTLSSSSDAVADSSTIVDSGNDAHKLKEQQNSNGKSIASDKPEAMEVDGIDTEEDDSQITSSTENGDGGDINKMSIDEASKPTPPAAAVEDSKDEETEAVVPEKAEANIDEDSSNACDDEAQNSNSSLNDSKPVAGEESQSQNSVSSLKQSKTVDTDDDDDEENESISSVESLHKQNVSSSSVLQDSEIKSPVKLTNNVDEPSMDAHDTKSSDHDNLNSTGSSADPLRTNTPERNSVAKQKTPEKTAKDAEQTSKTSDASIVDLDDDDSEEEQMSVPKKGEHSTSNDSSNKPKTPAVTESLSSKVKPACSTDSDGAVVIGSDSENEASSPPKAKAATKVVDQQVITDDDDDCIMIEDDAPPIGVNNSIKRKHALLETSTNNSDDSLPPSKRECPVPVGIPNITTTSKQPMNQLVIKDARSLLPQEVTQPKRPTDTGVYPVNLASAITPNIPHAGPPKLVPMGGGLGNMSPMNSGMSGMGTSNANLLPGLTDDMFVLEAPSFIVPYIYEKPPVVNLKDILKDLETKHKLTKEDLAEADRSDEFDMMTEQNKTDKEEKGEKRKKKRRGRDDADDSWSEDSEEDDEDEDEEDSDAGIRTKVLIKEASDDLTAIKGAIKPVAAVSQPVGAPAASAPKPGQENYFESPLGKFFMDIGVGLVQEFVQTDLIRLQKRKMRKSLGKNITDFERAITALSGNLEASRKKNAPFKFNMKRCEFCNFKSESALAMAHHYETPHMNGPLYKCNFCTFEIRNATEIVYHMEAMHNIKARLIKPLPYHQCPNCGFEDNGKAKLARHQPVCAKKFRPELNLAPPNDWEAPAKIPRIKPRHGLVGTATAYQAMAAQAAAQKAALASIQQQQAQVAQARSIQAAALAAQNAAAAKNIRGRPPILSKSQPAPMMRGVPPHHPIRSPMGTNLMLSNSYQMAAAGSQQQQQQQQQLLQQQQQQAANALAKKTLTGQPSISITPLPRQSAAPPQAPLPSTSKMPPTGMKPGQSPNSSGNKAQFVICEICDGYIKDLEQLRNHMQWMHKVKIHPKMIYNRPPLNCQKCQFRFFTDQGLERHLLGSHGLVTSSMQEAANKGKDAGRCPVCGRMYQWKLLNHVSRDHHMTLKQAHLSYKCTVCTATFGMYKQFETHVYTAHSTVAKKAIDNKKNNASTNLAASSSNATQRGSNSVAAANESLLKPLKINDEITIIPQPATKPRITNMESHVID